METEGSMDSGALLAEVDWVQRLARQLLGDEGEDLGQDALIAGIERPPTGDPRAWFGAVLRRQKARRLRDRGRRLRAEREAAARREEHGASAADTAARLEQHRHLAQAVLDLPEPQRGILVARFFDGIGPSEIAAQRGLRTGAVRAHLHRGLVASD